MLAHQVYAERVTAPHAHSNDDSRRLALALVLVGSTAGLELWGAYVTGSLALLADFGHVLSDFGALALALAAVRVGARRHTPQWTFGFHRAEVLAAGVNGLGLLAIALFITAQAAMRLRSAPPDVHAVGLISVATAGLVANGAAALLLARGESMNMRAARLHVLFDLGGSLIAIVAGAAIAQTGWTRIDALLSLAIVVLLIVAALRLLRGAIAVLMDAVPPGIDLTEVESALRSLNEIRAVHDVHCWAIHGDVVAFAAHIEVRTGHEPQHAITHAAQVLHDRFGIDHVTLQPELPTLHLPETFERSSTARG